MANCLGRSDPNCLGQVDPNCLGRGDPNCLGRGDPNFLGRGDPNFLGCGDPNFLGCGDPNFLGRGDPNFLGCGDPNFLGCGDPNFLGCGDPNFLGRGDPNFLTQKIWVGRVCTQNFWVVFDYIFLGRPDPKIFTVFLVALNEKNWIFFGDPNIIIKFCFHYAASSIRFSAHQYYFDYCTTSEHGSHGLSEYRIVLKLSRFRISGLTACFCGQGHNITSRLLWLLGHLSQIMLTL